MKVVDAELDNSMVKATVNSLTSKVKIKDSNGETIFNNPEAQRNISLKEDITEVIVEVTNGAGDNKEYTLYIVKENEEIDDVSLKQVFANDVEVMANEDGSYSVEIAENDSSVLHLQE